MTFETLRDSNEGRRREQLATLGGHEEWLPRDWMLALVGEVGEAANILKKIKRGDYTLEERRSELADELGDIQTYLDLLSTSLGIDLGTATKSKWNQVSARHGSIYRI